MHNHQVHHLMIKRVLFNSTKGAEVYQWTSHQHTEEKMDIKRKDSAESQVTNKGDATVQKQNSSELEIRNQQKPCGRRY